MTIDPKQAGAMLAEVESVVARVKQSRIYRASGVIIMLWGGLIVCGDLVVAAGPRWAELAWVALDIFGVVATVVLLARVRGSAGRFPARFLAAFALFVAFGFVWSEVFAHLGPRQLVAFWPTVFLFGYALAGLWFGLAFTFLGLTLAALIVAGFLWSGDWFPLYLALVNGGGLILCGLAMRRA